MAEMDLQPGSGFPPVLCSDLGRVTSLLSLAFLCHKPGILMPSLETGGGLWRRVLTQAMV